MCGGEQWLYRISLPPLDFAANLNDSKKLSLYFYNVCPMHDKLLKRMECALYPLSLPPLQQALINVC